MAFWWVNQGKTYNEEKNGFLWTSKKGKNGKVPFHWQHMYELKEGDIVFSYVKGYIKSYSIVIKEHYSSQKRFNTANNWNPEGIKVDLIYNELIYPISLEDFNDHLYKIQPKMHAPLNSTRGVNMGYLYTLNDASGTFLLNIIEKNENIDVSDTIVSTIANSNSIDSTTQKSLIESRKGQGKFRNDLFQIWNGKCAVNSLDIDKLLIASHCKPWKYSNDFERLDPNNGLLLSPIYDKLFDLGFITFNKFGNIVISEKLTIQQKQVLNISEKDKLSIQLNDKQIEYLKYHEQEIFK